MARDVDELLMHSKEPSVALSEMAESSIYDPRFLTALKHVHVQQGEREVRLLSLAELKASMTTNGNVYSKAGLLLMGTDQEITASAIARLQTFALTTGVAVPISVRMPHSRRWRNVRTDRSGGAGTNYRRRLSLLGGIAPAFRGSLYALSAHRFPRICVDHAPVASVNKARG